MKMKKLFFVVCCLSGFTLCAGIDWGAQKTDVWEGCTRHLFEIDGVECWVVEPAKPRDGNPWIWCTEWPGAFHERTAGRALLEEGFYYLHAKVGTMCLGSPRALAQMDAFYKFFTAKGLAKKGALSGVSRGGLYCFRFAWQYPERVACLYGDHAVLDFKSWPMRVTDGAFNPASPEVAETLRVYGFKSLAEALAYRRNPVDYEVLKVLATAKIPVLLVIGEADEAVPPEYNANVFVSRYRALGGEVKEIRVPGCGHHPHGVDNPREIADWIIQQTDRTRTVSCGD